VCLLFVWVPQSCGFQQLIAVIYMFLFVVKIEWSRCMCTALLCMCECVCVCECMRACVCVSMHAYVCVCVCACMHVGMCVCYDDHAHHRLYMFFTFTWMQLCHFVWDCFELCLPLICFCFGVAFIHIFLNLLIHKLQSWNLQFINCVIYVLRGRRRKKGK